LGGGAGQKRGGGKRGNLIKTNKINKIKSSKQII